MSACLVSLMEVSTGVATFQGLARHSSHEADNDFLALMWNSKAGMRVFYDFQQWYLYRLDSGAVAKNIVALML